MDNITEKLDFTKKFKKFKKNDAKESAPTTTTNDTGAANDLLIGGGSPKKQQEGGKDEFVGSADPAKKGGLRERTRGREGGLRERTRRRVSQIVPENIHNIKDNIKNKIKIKNENKTNVAERPSYRTAIAPGGGGGAGDLDDDANSLGVNSKRRTFMNEDGTHSIQTDAMSIQQDDVADNAAAHSVMRMTEAMMVENSNGTKILNRILQETLESDHKTKRTFSHKMNHNNNIFGGADDNNNRKGITKMERVSNPTKVSAVSSFAARVVVPPLKVDRRSTGATKYESYPVSMHQETLLCFKCKSFEATGTDVVAHSALEYFHDYAKHKRNLGMFSAGIGTSKNRNKHHYVLLARSTNKPLVLGLRNVSEHKNDKVEESEEEENEEEEEEDVGYNMMYSPDAAGLGGGGHKGNIRNDMDSDSSVEGELGEGIGMASKWKKVNAHNVNVKIGGKKSFMTMLKDTILLAVDEEEISSFPALICMTLNHDGTTPDIRKLIQLDKLEIVQDLQGSTVQLIFKNGDIVRIDLGIEENKTTAATRQMHKERFIWQLLQIHAMLCVSVVERTSLAVNNASSSEKNKTTTQQKLHQQENEEGGRLSSSHQHHPELPTESNLISPIVVRNIDRAELQYLATVNNFIGDDNAIKVLLHRQNKLEILDAPASEGGGGKGKGDNDGKEEEKNTDEDLDKIAYSLMMGTFATHVAIFQNEGERKNAEEILNSTQWTFDLKNQDVDAAASVAERLKDSLETRMRNLEAETCRRLIAWEDEKFSATKTNKIGTKIETNGVEGKSDDGDSGGKGSGAKGGAKDNNKAENDNDEQIQKTEKFRAKTDINDSVDQSSLRSLFTTLDALDKKLQMMENWLTKRTETIKPITDDCRHIEVENRQLQQQWKSYEKLSDKMNGLLNGLQLGKDVELILNNPARAMKYITTTGAIDTDASEEGKEQIVAAGIKLQVAMRHVHECGGLHLKAVRQRADALEVTARVFCTALAQVIVTVMEQFKTEVVANSDSGKVSKNDTHTDISRKIRNTQKEFHYLLGGYSKVVGILAELSPELLPVVRDAYSELVSNGIMMQTRMKGYFKALPGKNLSYLYNVSKDLKDYKPNDVEETVHANDIRYSLVELLPIIFEEAYFTSALFRLTGHNDSSSSKNKKSHSKAKRKENVQKKKWYFDAAKKSVDRSSKFVCYYIQKTCGIVQDFNRDPILEGGLLHDQHHNGDDYRGDPMLCFVATVHLNEAITKYVARRNITEARHSLSLAYVRATILDLCRKVDKQWIAWAKEQIKWIQSDPGVLMNGKKRVGIMQSFLKFPFYLDHVLLCCREKKEEGGYMPDLAKVKVVSHYLRKMGTALLKSLSECAKKRCKNNKEDPKKYASANLILLMENSYYFVQQVKDRGPIMSKLFQRIITKANEIYENSSREYFFYITRTEFFNMHELFVQVRLELKQQKKRDAITEGDSSHENIISEEVSSILSKTDFVHAITKEFTRDILKEKIIRLYTRMSKHLCDESGLLPDAWKALVKFLYECVGRWETSAMQVYSHKLRPQAVEVLKISKAAEGTFSDKKIGGGIGVGISGGDNNNNASHNNLGALGVNTADKANSSTAVGDTGAKVAGTG